MNDTLFQPASRRQMTMVRKLAEEANVVRPHVVWAHEAADAIRRLRSYLTRHGSP